MARNDEQEGTVALAEAPVETQVSETPAEGESAPESVQAGESSTTDEKPAEAKADEKAGPSPEEVDKAVLEFLAKAKEIADTRDPSTGEIADAQKAVVKAAYGELPTTPARTKARNGLDECMKRALSEELDAAQARAYMILGQTVKSTVGRPETVARAPIDPTEAFVDRVAAMYVAPNLVSVPEGIADDWPQRVQSRSKSLAGEIKAYKAWVSQHEVWLATDEDKRGDEPAAPEVSDVVTNAYRLARGRVVGTRKPKAESGTSVRTTNYTGPRRSVKAHILSAFSDVPVGTFMKISAIANKKSAEYGDDSPSSGAVSAALFPASGKAPNIEGIEPVEVGGVKGARKVS